MAIVIKYLRKIRMILRFLLKVEPYCRIDAQLPMERIGDGFCGWNVFLDDLNECSIVYSFGVGEDVSFDVGLINRFGLKIHAFDPTPKSIGWVNDQKLPAQFIMHEYGVSNFDGDVLFNPPENPNAVSHTLLERNTTKKHAIALPVKRISSIMSDLGHDKINVLKMDIEGAEYDVIDDLLSSSIFPDQVLIEFHHRFEGVGIDKTKQAVKQLKSVGYKLFAISDSNEDFSFIRSV